MRISKFLRRENWIKKQLVQNLHRFKPNELTEDSVIRKIRITASDGKEYLQILRDDGYIKREGKTRSAYWVVLKK